MSTVSPKLWFETPQPLTKIPSLYGQYRFVELTGCGGGGGGGAGEFVFPDTSGIHDGGGGGGSGAGIIMEKFPVAPSCEYWSITVGGWGTTNAGPYASGGASDDTQYQSSVESGADVLFHLHDAGGNIMRTITLFGGGGGLDFTIVGEDQVPSNGGNGAGWGGAGDHTRFGQWNPPAGTVTATTLTGPAGTDQGRTGNTHWNANVWNTRYSGASGGHGYVDAATDIPQDHGGNSIHFGGRKPEGTSGGGGGGGSIFGMGGAGGPANSAGLPPSLIAYGAGGGGGGMNAPGAPGGRWVLLLRWGSYTDPMSYIV